jgi:dihydroorotate dehydrogenase
VSALERLGLAALRRLHPETAHGLALKALSAGLAPLPRKVKHPALRTTLAGLDLPNPLGLAAGFDKNGTAIAALSRAGFGFLELGATTPRPQPGNPRPRLFRLMRDEAVINRFGFNNEGAQAMAARLARRPRNTVIGLNLGANKDSDDRAGDFARVLEICGPRLDFATVNVSSPNTERLRDLQGRAALAGLLRGVLATRDALERPIPIFLKIAPDLSEDELDDIAGLALEMRLDAVIATNTTLERTGLHGPHKAQAGGLSGRPLFEKSTRVLAGLHRRMGADVPLIGVGGIASAQDALTKIRAGATALQLYTALSCHGLGLVPRILSGLADQVQMAGVQTLSELRGTDTALWT